MTSGGELDLAPDVLVIGGGVAAFIAAARAREQGASVTLVKKAGGGTVSSSGAIDVADELVGLVPGPSFDPFERGGRFRKAADMVAAKKPRHPYARLVHSRDRLREALSLLKELAMLGGLELIERE
ncbi:MAG TPA: FAD-binding protein, partial [Myxococcota bacterium]